MPTSTYSQPEFLVSQRVKPGSAEARRMTAGSGQRLLGLYANYLPTGVYLRTCLVSLLSTEVWNSSVCVLRWKKKVTPYGRLLFQLAPSMPSTEGTEFGLWGTPTTRDHKDTGNCSNVPVNGLLGRQVKLWPTMASASHGLDGGSGNRKKLREMVGDEVGRQMASGSLNPAWVEWLMGYPKDWTEVKDFVHTKKNGKSRESQRELETESID